MGWLGASRIKVLIHRDTRRLPVIRNPTGIRELLVGVGDVDIVGVEDDVTELLVVHIRTRSRPGCWGFGGPVCSKGTRAMRRRCLAVRCGWCGTSTVRFRSPQSSHRGPSAPPSTRRAGFASEGSRVRRDPQADQSQRTIHLRIFFGYGGPEISESLGLFVPTIPLAAGLSG